VSDELVARLRTAGCVFAEDEARLLRETFDADELDAAATRRTNGMPLEQVVGFAELDGLRVDVAPGVFVPRRRAAAIVDAAAAERPDARVVVDLGCGAGALTVLLRRALPGARVIGVELDPVAIACARDAAARHDVELVQGSWWSALPRTLRGRIDLAVGYLPHVPSAKLGDVHPDFRAHEPRTSVDGGADGLDPWRQVTADASDWLAANGLLVTLVAPEQASAAERIADLAGFVVASTPSDDDLLLLASSAPNRESDLP